MLTIRPGEHGSTYGGEPLGRGTRPGRVSRGGHVVDTSRRRPARAEDTSGVNSVSSQPDAVNRQPARVRRRHRGAQRLARREARRERRGHGRPPSRTPRGHRLSGHRRRARARAAPPRGGGEAATALPPPSQSAPCRLACRRGLLNAVVVRPDGANDAGALCHALMGAGLLAKPTHGDIIRLAPPLVISEEQVLQAADIIEREARNSRRVGGGGGGGTGVPHTAPHPPPPQVHRMFDERPQAAAA